MGGWWFRWRGALYIAQEYVAGTDLATVLDELGRLPPEIAAPIALQVARGLEEIHARGIVHRDLKPANVLLGRAGDVKVADFGVALDFVSTPLTRTGHTVGTPLVWNGPGIPRGKRTDAQCYLRDLYPTICELVGIDIPETVQGRSLAPVIRGEKESIYSCVFGHFRNVQRMIRTDRWKLIHYPKIDKFQLFDLANDHYELNNLADNSKHANVGKRLRDTLRAWQKDVGDPVVTDSVGSATIR